MTWSARVARLARLPQRINGVVTRSVNSGLQQSTKKNPRALRRAEVKSTAMRFEALSGLLLAQE